MFSLGSLWIFSTLAASAAQTARNVMQRHLTASLGTMGATQVRFLYGFPFALLFLVALRLASGAPVPTASWEFIAFIVTGAVTQIGGTGCMLAAMRSSGFAVTIAFTKTEPVMVAVFGIAILGEHLTPGAASGIVLATVGVVLMSQRPATEALGSGSRAAVLLGLGSAALYAIAAVAFRGAIIGLPEGSFLMRAATALVWGLGVQTLLLGAYLICFNPAALIGSLKAWRQSLFAGFMGALASQFWFIGFSLTSAANVRTLGLVEVVFAQLVSRRLAETVNRRQLTGMALVVIGVGVLLLFQPE